MRNVILGLILALFPSLAPAEVIWAKLYWKPDFCPASCYPLLERRLESIDCVSRVDFNFVEGCAKLVWKPNQPYDDRRVRTPVAWVGLHISDVRLRIRGIIEHDDKEVFIVSLGDGTRMPLLSPPKPEEGRYVSKPNRAAYSIEPTLKDRLIASAKKHPFEIIAEVRFESRSNSHRDGNLRYILTLKG
jgi:hypothetical protein